MTTKLQLAFQFFEEQQRDQSKSIIGIMSETNPKTARFVSDLFNFMEFAESEIRNGMEKYPDKAVEINRDCFMLLMPPTIMLDYGETAYRIYCRQIIDRYAQGIDTEPPTTIEILCVLMLATWKGPLVRNASYAAYILFEKCFGKDFTDRLINNQQLDRFTEEWPGAGEEIISSIRKKYVRYS
jgi:hypothetical protein